MLSELGRRPKVGGGANEDSFGDDFEKELGLLLREHRRQEADDHERELNLYRSGSAPPTVEGSRSAVGGLFGTTAHQELRNGNGLACDDDFRLDPAYHSYYYSNVNLNPRLPPPLLSREELRFSQRMKGGSSIANEQSLFSMPSGLDARKRDSDVEAEIHTRASSEWAGDGLIGLPGGQGGSHKGQSYAAAVGGSLSRSTTPDPQLIARLPSPCPTPIGAGRAIAAERRGVSSSASFSNGPCGINTSSDIVSALSGLNLSGSREHDLEHRQSYMFNGHDQMRHHMLSKQSVDFTDSSYDEYMQPDFQKYGPFLGNSYVKGSPTSTLNSGGGLPQNSSFTNTGLGGYGFNPSLASMMAAPLGPGPVPPHLDNVAAATALGLQGFDSRVHQIAGNAFVDPLYAQYLRTSEYASQLAALNDPMMINNSYIPDLQKAYLGQLLAPPQKPQYGGKYDRGYYGGPLANHGPVGPASPMNMPYPPMMRNLGSRVMPSWHVEAGFNKGLGSSLLEEFKCNKAKCFDLSEIANHVVEFSSDQYGSRFIQQKLETASVEEKTMVYKEIGPHALELMTDVFGNYVIQKFFEHGLASQTREMAEKLFGNVLALSLQMYGCRVIQKAIEVVDLDQKIQMVKELDGNVMRCVRDQNGNHVIQKCIECVPEHNIQFIVSTFFDQIVTLSTHPYGCRVVQRILEHCEEENTQNKVMEEILSSVSMLSQDQYGNYVIQHVLQHGKPHERSVIITELAGKIVQMSQQKFASNVVEKCLAFGDPSERLLLVKEMLGTTDENEPLQAMMKDQFGNYVVQKVLETCDDQMRELILSRIKLHLNALKKYTYGKHIVARVEKLVAAGERRMGMQTVSTAQPVA